MLIDGIGHKQNEKIIINATEFNKDLILERSDRPWL